MVTRDRSDETLPEGQFKTLYGARQQVGDVGERRLILKRSHSIPGGLLFDLRSANGKSSIIALDHSQCHNLVDAIQDALGFSTSQQSVEVGKLREQITDLQRQCADLEASVKNWRDTASSFEAMYQDAQHEVDEMRVETLKPEEIQPISEEEVW